MVDNCHHQRRDHWRVPHLLHYCLRHLRVRPSTETEVMLD